MLTKNQTSSWATVWRAPTYHIIAIQGPLKIFRIGIQKTSYGTKVPNPDRHQVSQVDFFSKSTFFFNFDRKIIERGFVNTHHTGLHNKKFKGVINFKS